MELKLMLKWWCYFLELSSVSVSVDKKLEDLSVSYRLKVLGLVCSEYMRLDTF